MHRASAWPASFAAQGEIAFAAQGEIAFAAQGEIAFAAQGEIAFAAHGEIAFALTSLQSMPSSVMNTVHDHCEQCSNCGESQKSGKQETDHGEQDRGAPRTAEAEADCDR
ncbi:hypothetical protein [Mesorhizobium sp. L-8-3]|uniref:hypothetical protein n=1 Tax=Mesorhizobium sp. L-8-3 TaxID=2744522 RepID=UPI001927BC08|nr:hypothetical protein [Mesorhizobium sp. L-8-3]